MHFIDSITFGLKDFRIGIGHFFYLLILYVYDLIMNICNMLDTSACEGSKAN